MGLSNNNLNKAIKVKDDEFYTKMEDIIKIDEELKIYDYCLKNNLKIACPFSGAESNFVKYWQRQGLLKGYGLDYKSFVWYDEDVIVFDNPPFSKIREIIEYYMNHNIKFILFSSVMSKTYHIFLKYFNQQKINVTNYYQRSMKFHNNKVVNIDIITNIPHFYINRFLTTRKGKVVPKSFINLKNEIVQLEWSGSESINYNKHYTLQHFYTQSFHENGHWGYLYTTSPYNHRLNKKIFKRFKWERYNDKQHELIIKRRLNNGKRWNT